MNKKNIQLGIIFFTIFIDMMGFGIVIPILPKYVEILGATSMQIGVLMGVFSLAQFLMLPFWGQLSDRVGRKPVLLLSVFGTTIGTLMMAATHSLPLMIIARAIDGAAGGNIATLQACLSDVTTSDERAKAMGLLGAAYGLGFIFL